MLSMGKLFVSVCLISKEESIPIRVVVTISCPQIPCLDLSGSL